MPCTREQKTRSVASVVVTPKTQGMSVYGFPKQLMSIAFLYRILQQQQDLTDKNIKKPASLLTNTVSDRQHDTHCTFCS